MYLPSTSLPPHPSSLSPKPSLSHPLPQLNPSFPRPTVLLLGEGHLDRGSVRLQRSRGRVWQIRRGPEPSSLHVQTSHLRRSMPRMLPGIRAEEMESEQRGTSLPMRTWVRKDFCFVYFLGEVVIDKWGRNGDVSCNEKVLQENLQKCIACSWSLDFGVRKDSLSVNFRVIDPILPLFPSLPVLRSRWRVSVRCCGGRGQRIHRYSRPIRRRWRLPELSS